MEIGGLLKNFSDTNKRKILACQSSLSNIMLNGKWDRKLTESRPNMLLKRHYPVTTIMFRSGVSLF